MGSREATELGAPAEPHVRVTPWHVTVLGGLGALVAVVAAEVVSVVSFGTWRLDVVVLAVLFREVRSWSLRAVAVAVALTTVVLVPGSTQDALLLAAIGVLEATAVALVVSRTLAPARGAVSFGGRFVATVGLLTVVVLAGSVAETAVEGWRSDVPGLWSTFVGTTLPLATAAFTAAAVLAWRPLVVGVRASGARLLGPLAALAVTMLAMQLVTGYWAADEQQVLDTAASTVAASYQQVLADDMTSLAARTSTPPTVPLNQRDQDAFVRWSQPLVDGSASVTGAALVAPGPDGQTVPFATGKSDNDVATLRATVADKASAGVIMASMQTGVPLLIGLRESTAADGTAVALAVYVAPIKAANGAEAVEMLATSVSIPVAFAQGALAIGALREQVSSTLDLVAGPEGAVNRTVAVDNRVALADGVESKLAGSSQAGVGDYTFSVVVRPGPDFGVSIVTRLLVLLTMLLLGLAAAVLLIQVVSARERSRRDAAEREALLAVALESAPGRVFIVDSHSRVLVSNRETGPAGDAVGRPALDVLPFVLHGEEGDRVRRLVERARLGESGAIEYTDTSSGISPLTYLIQVSPVASDLVGDARSVIQVKDLTEERARAVRTAQSERLRSLGTMAGGLAHDFNNLLFIISGYLQMLHEDDVIAESDRLSRYVERASDAAERGAEIASSLLSVARSQPLEATAIEVVSLVQRLSPLVRQAVGSERNVVIDVGEGPLDVLVDSGQLSGSILNLVINSRDAMEPGGTVTISIRRELVDDPALELSAQDYVVIEVEDDGIGMTPEVQQRAFEPYFTTKGVGDGTGIGLAAVYSFAQQSGGLATIRSEYGIGTSVRVYLPAVFAENSAPAASRAGQPGSVSRVLVVDDETALAGLIAGWLTEQGAEVRVADTPAQALRLAGEFQPDVLLTDVRLGDPAGVDGPELAEQVAAVVPGVSVVFMTGFSDRMDDLIDRGMHTLAKPFTKEALVRVLFPVDAAAVHDDAGATGER